MKLFFREYGTGVPLIILHGLYGSSDNWVSIAKKLSSDFRVILPDLRNHGKSDHHPIHTYKSMASDISEMSEDLGLDKYFLAGHSMGGKCALEISRCWPEKLMGLTIIDISPFKAQKTNNSALLMHRNILDRLIILDSQDIESREKAGQVLSAGIPSPRIREFLLKNLKRNKDRKLVLRLNPHVLKENIDNILDGLPREKTANPVSGFPLTFLRATESDYIPKEDIELIEQHYPAANIINVDRSSHWLHAERPDIVIEILRDQLL